MIMFNSKSTYKIENSNPHDTLFDFNPDDFSENDLTKVSSETCNEIKAIEPSLRKLNLIKDARNKNNFLEQQFKQKTTRIQQDQILINNYLNSICPEKSCCPQRYCYACLDKFFNIFPILHYVDGIPYISILGNPSSDGTPCICNAILFSEKNLFAIPLGYCDNYRGKNMFVDTNFPKEIKAAILRTFFASPNSIQNYNKIIYGKMLDSIHFNIISYLTDKELSVIHAQNGGNVEHSIRIRADKLKNDLLRFYSMNNFEYAQAENLHKNLFSKFNLELNKESSSAPSHKKFHQLAATLMALTNCDPTNLDKLAILFAKIFMGRKVLKTLEIKKHSTIIFSNNTFYINKFLFNILTFGERLWFIISNCTAPNYLMPDGKYHHITDYSAKDLCNPEMKETFIKDKIIGNIVNIDTSKEIGNPDILKKLISGTAVFAGEDSIAGSLIYRSNAHYIFLKTDITCNLDKYLLENSDIIDLSSSSLETLIYDPLDFCELYFIATALVEYGIHLLLTETERSTPSTAIFPHKTFIEDYCTFTNNENDFSHIDILYDTFKQLQESRKQSCSTKNELRDYIKDLYPSLEYKKKKTPRKDGQAFFGLKFNEEKALQDINTLPTQEKVLPKEAFLNHLYKIKKNHFPHV